MGKHRKDTSRSRSRSRSPMSLKSSSHTDIESRRPTRESAYKVHSSSSRQSEKSRVGKKGEKNEEILRSRSRSRSPKKNEEILRSRSRSRSPESSRDSKPSYHESESSRSRSRDQDSKSRRKHERNQDHKWSASGKWDVEASADKTEGSTTNETLCKATGNLRKRIFHCEGTEEAIVVMLHPESIPVKGKLSIQCLTGAVSVFGYHIHPDNKCHNVYSPETNSLLSLQTLEGSQNDQDYTAVKKLTMPEHYTEIEKYCKANNNAVVILFKSLNHLELEFIATLPQYQSIFTGAVKNSTLEYCCSVPDLDVILYPHQTGSSMDTNVFTVTPNMSIVEEKLVARIKECKQEQRKFPIIVLAGGKSVGKSSFARYLLNSLLNQVDSVAFLDGDLGQTEFTPAGCLTLSQVSQPVLGPPFSHQRKPLSCCFHGNLSPGDDPALYVRCLSFVYKKMSSLNAPLIVNTMGWTQGIGLALMVDTLRMLEPDFVIQIDSPARFKNYSCLTPQSISSVDGWTTKKDSTPVLEYSLMRLETPVSSQMQSRDYYKPIDHRTLSLVANLGSMFKAPSPGYQLNSLCPVKVAWDRVAVHIAHVSVPNSQVLYSLNASVVALCQLPESQLVSSDIEGYPKFVKGFPVCPCLGLGFIRAIDPEAKLFYILTPMSTAELADVNCLVRGAPELPPQLLLNQYDGSDRVPYVGYSKDVIGATSVHRRNFMARR